MPETNTPRAADGVSRRRLFVFNGGFLTNPRVRRILSLAGYDIKLGKPGQDDLVGVWGKSPTSPRGETVANKTDSPILRIEDALLRSILPGRSGDPALGLHLDQSGVHFDSSAPSDLEKILSHEPLDDSALLARARHASDHLKRSHLSKYNAFSPDDALPRAPYVLVIDQTRGDASIKYGGANAATFREMLVFAQEEHPGARVIIKTHPETLDGHREGHFGKDDENGRITLWDKPVSPWALMEGALGVYTVSSQLGFEAIFAGHKPRVFGQPFYGGWGLTQDENPVPRRQRKLTKAQLFAAAMFHYPTWYDPYRDQLCELEQVIETLEAQSKAWRQDHHGHVALGMRLWKRSALQSFFGRWLPLEFAEAPSDAVEKAAQTNRSVIVWAGKETPDLRALAQDAKVSVLRIEDGFLRSKGLGAELVPPLSLVADDLGIYYDPSRESRLERHIAAACDLPQPALARSEALMQQIRKAGLSKYNLAAQLPADLPQGHRILVPGQVEDDASILLGCGAIRSNLDLLRATRDANPDAVVIYKPHPDVEAGLRAGKLARDEVLKYADVIADHADPIALIEAVDEVWTLTSLLGFEALMRDTAVCCLGTPFYAGWGLTRDLGQVPQRRSARPNLRALVHAVLIDYPRYFDPVSKLPCPPEIIVERLATGNIPTPKRAHRLLSKLQGIFASYARFWR